MTNWNTSNPGGVEQFHYSMGEAINYLVPRLKENKRCYFSTDLHTLVCGNNVY